MPTKKAREENRKEIEAALESAVAEERKLHRKGKIPKDAYLPKGKLVPTSKKKSSDVKKVKPKPVSKKLPDKPLEIYELAALYEHLCRDTVTDNYRTWPDITIAEVRELVKEINPKDLSGTNAELYRNGISLDENGSEKVRGVRLEYKDLREFRGALIDREISIGMSIPLFIEHFNMSKNDPTIISLTYCWCAHSRAMEELRKKQGKAQTRTAPVASGDFCFELECNAEQALLLERYCNAYHGTLIACRDYLKTLGGRAPQRMDKISGKLATQIRKEHSFEDVPRSLIVSALNGYSHKIKFNKTKEFEKEIGKFYLRDNFKLDGVSLTVGKAKYIAISKIIAGENLGLPVDGMYFVRLTPLIYSVAVSFDRSALVPKK